MGEMIQKPDANPILLAVLNAFVAGGLGYFLMGQKAKAIRAWIIWVVCVVVSPFCFGLSGLGAMALALATAYDAYLLGQKLQAGESIGENEVALDFLAKAMPQ